MLIVWEETLYILPSLLWVNCSLNAIHYKEHSPLKIAKGIRFGSPESECAFVQKKKEEFKKATVVCAYIWTDGQRECLFPQLSLWHVVDGIKGVSSHDALEGKVFKINITMLCAQN